MTETTAVPAHSGFDALMGGTQRHPAAFWYFAFAWGTLVLAAATLSALAVAGQGLIEDGALAWSSSFSLATASIFCAGGVTVNRVANEAQAESEVR